MSPVDTNYDDEGPGDASVLPEAGVPAPVASSPDAGSSGSPALASAMDSGVDASSGTDSSISADSANDAERDSSPGADSGSTLDSETPTECKPTAETCFNGRDDDCDGTIDCADSDCSAGAICVADGAQVGVLVMSGQPCPTGYSKASGSFHRDLAAGECTGCSCGTATATTCNATIVAYPEETGSASSPCSDGRSPARFQLSSFTCPAEPPLMGFWTGALLESISTVSGTCPAQGQARAEAVTWGQTRDWCVTQMKGHGCEAAHVCVPRTSTGQTCAESTGGRCATGYSEQTWFTGVSDTRRCSPCACTASGASCDGVRALVGNDWQCDEATSGVLTIGQRTCGGAASRIFTFSPGVRLLGSPSSATCRATSSLTGSATPTGSRGFCCR